MAARDEIECLTRLFMIGAYMDDMVDFFIAEGVMNRTELPTLKSAPDKAKYIQQKIANAKYANILMLADFEWQILPYERIRIYFVTARVQKEILYNNV